MYQYKRWNINFSTVFPVLVIALTFSLSILLHSKAVLAQAQRSQPSSAESQTSTPPQGEDHSLIADIFGTESGSSRPFEDFWFQAARALISFSLSAALAAALAFRPRRDIAVFRRNPFVAQTQILLAVVGAAMMIVVADNAARAIGIFAAAALIRFRTNIRNPKEITVLLICLSIGLAAGVGRWELAVILTLFALLILWPLEWFEANQIYRAMELKVKTRDPEETNEILKAVFKRHNIIAELRKFDREDEKDPLGTILYYLSATAKISTDKLSKDILSSDSENIDSIQWDQKKSRSYIYR